MLPKAGCGLAEAVVEEVANTMGSALLTLHRHPLARTVTCKTSSFVAETSTP
jgi:hypothetical protein